MSNGYIAPIKKYKPPFDRPGLAGIEMLMHSRIRATPNAALMSTLANIMPEGQAAGSTMKHAPEVGRALQHLIRDMELNLSWHRGSRMQRLMSTIGSKLDQLLGIYPGAGEAAPDAMQRLLLLLGR